jgi:hypothetical protein
MKKLAAVVGVAQRTNNHPLRFVIGTPPHISNAA